MSAILLRPSLCLALIACHMLCNNPVSARQTSKQTAKSAPLALPTDVQAFLTKRQACDHFRGEDPYDAERRAFLDARIEQYCKGTDAALAALRHKYRDTPRVMARLFPLDPKVE